jgi:hypothetical protein
MAASVLLVGNIPELVDYSNFPGLDAEKVRAAVMEQLFKLKQLGYNASQLFVDLGETAEDVLTAEFSKRSYDCILIGAGMRVPPPRLLQFEKILNLIRQKAPKAAICFNTNPGDSIDAIRRWV